MTVIDACDTQVLELKGRGTWRYFGKEVLQAMKPSVRVVLSA
jgi:hypothetical protein